MKEIFADQPGRPKPIIDSAPPQPVPVAATTIPMPAASPAVAPPQTTMAPDEAGSGTSSVPAAGPSPFEKAAAGLIEAGVAFLESIAASAGNGQSAHAGDMHHSLSPLFSRDPLTNRPILSIPLPASVTAERVAEAVTGFLRGLQRH